MKALLSVLCTLLAFAVVAQSNQTEGTIYFHDKTVVKAFFYLKAAEGTPQQFSYSTATNAAAVTIDAAGAEKIELQDGTVYESHVVTIPVISKDYLSRSKADYDNSENRFQGSAFVERVITGNIAFYQLVDRYGYPHFFYRLAADTALILLRNNSYVEQGVITYDQAYKNQLSFLNRKFCTATAANVAAVDYALKPMLNAFATFNSCSGAVANTAAYLEKKKATLNVGVLGGVLSSALGLKSYQRSVNPTFGAYLDITPGKAYKNYKISLEAGYQSFDQNEDSVIYAISHSQTRAAFSVANLNVMTRFYLSHQQQSPFVEAGPNFNYAFGHILTTGTKDMVFNSVQTTKMEGGNLFYFGLTGGIGYDFHRLSLHARMGLMMHQNDDWIKNYVGFLAKVRLTNK